VIAAVEVCRRKPKIGRAVPRRNGHMLVVYASMSCRIGRQNRWSDLWGRRLSQELKS
jgi:hypothetical protein